MNKAKAVAVAIYLFVMLGVGIYAHHDSHTEKTYGVDAMVVSAHDGMVYTIDSDGMQYAFEGAGYDVYQDVRLIMSNSATPDRHDDAVIGAVTL